MMKHIARFSVLLLVLFASSASHAVLTIEITKGLATGMPIAIVPFFGERTNPFSDSVSTIINNDLTRSGRFNTIAKKDFLSLPRNVSDINYKDWRLIKSEALVMGNIEPRPGGLVHVEMYLYDVFKQERLIKAEYTWPASGLRAVAHQLSDMIYEKLTGERGAFSTRIAYISKEGSAKAPRYRVYVSDADGYNAQWITNSPEPLLSLSWSPDGESLAYVSFEQGRAMVFVQDVNGKKPRVKLPTTSGATSAPAWSPDGSRIALAMNKGGNADIYIYSLTDRTLTRLTRSPADDTEPAWSPDGRQIVFNSDRSGRPQIYRTSVSEERPERLTFEGDFNARPSFAPDGKMLTLITRIDGQDRVGLLNLQDGSLQVLTDTARDDSPSFAPNGRMILYETKLQGRGVLAAVSADGQVRQTLRSPEGDIRGPAWSPKFQTQNKGVTQ